MSWYTLYSDDRIYNTFEAPNKMTALAQVAADCPFKIERVSAVTEDCYKIVCEKGSVLYIKKKLTDEKEKT